MKKLIISAFTAALLLPAASQAGAAKNIIKETNSELREIRQDYRDDVRAERRDYRTTRRGVIREGRKDLKEVRQIRRDTRSNMSDDRVGYRTFILNDDGVSRNAIRLRKRRVSTTEDFLSR